MRRSEIGEARMGEQVKVLLSYDIRPSQENAYRRFIMEDFLPKAQELGLTPTDAWHTAWGKYPNRLIGFVAEDLGIAREVMQGDEWQELVSRLQGHVGNLTQRIVSYKGGFQW
jgi:hypothetical protein